MDLQDTDPTTGQVADYVCRPAQEPKVLALFTVLHHQVALCKQAADLLQRQSADWEVHDWNLVAFKATMNAAGLLYHGDCLSCVGIPL